MRRKRPAVLASGQSVRRADLRFSRRRGSRPPHTQLGTILVGGPRSTTVTRRGDRSGRARPVRHAEDGALRGTTVGAAATPPGPRPAAVRGGPPCSVGAALARGLRRGAHPPGALAIDAPGGNDPDRGAGRPVRVEPAPGRPGHPRGVPGVRRGIDQRDVRRGTPPRTRGAARPGAGNRRGGAHLLPPPDRRPRNARCADRRRPGRSADVPRRVRDEPDRRRASRPARARRADRRRVGRGQGGARPVAPPDLREEGRPGGGELRGSPRRLPRGRALWPREGRILWRGGGARRTPPRSAPGHAAAGRGRRHVTPAPGQAPARHRGPARPPGGERGGGPGRRPNRRRHAP